MAKMYRVNSSEHFNLDSMRTHLICNRIDFEEGTIAWNKAAYEANEKRIEEIEHLMEKAYCVGALVDWPTLKRIREIKEERCFIRYVTCINAGMPESEAGLAFTD